MLVRRCCLLLASSVLASSAAVADEAAMATVVIERNEAAVGTPAYVFPTVSAPSKTDAAAAGKVRVLEGQVDSNSGGPRRLIDGEAGQSSDDPEASFFFQGGRRSSRSGRVVITLSRPTDVLAIQTYSWHPGERGPQVFAVYGDGGNLDTRLPDRTHRNVEELGWKRLATVDTRTAEPQPGGQYAVRISKAGGSLGKQQRLLFDVQPTADGSTFAQTFFQEIDVLDGQEYEPAPAAMAEIDWFDIGDKYRIGFDTSDAPDLKPWVDEKLKPVCAAWYPKIVELLPSEGNNPPEKFTITFHEDMEGVAHCSGTSIHCAARWYRTQLDREGLGSIVHEMVHVVQQYGRLGSGRRNPSWLVEGVADYIRWHLYEPPTALRAPNPRTAKYTDSYRTTAAFLVYVVDQKGPEVIPKLNAAMRNGTYTADTWMTVTGTTVDALWEEYVKTLEPKK